MQKRKAGRKFRRRCGQSEHHNRKEGRNALCHGNEQVPKRFPCYEKLFARLPYYCAAANVAKARVRRHYKQHYRSYHARCNKHYGKQHYERLIIGAHGYYGDYGHYHQRRYNADIKRCNYCSSEQQKHQHLRAARQLMHGRGAGYKVYYKLVIHALLAFLSCAMKRRVTCSGSRPRCFAKV